MGEGATGASTLPVVTLGVAASILEPPRGASVSSCILSFMRCRTRARAEVKAPCSSGVSFAKRSPAFLMRGKEEPGKDNLPQELPSPVRAQKSSEDEALLVEWRAVLPGIVVACEECAGPDRTENEVRAVQEFRTR